MPSGHLPGSSGPDTDASPLPGIGPIRDVRPDENGVTITTADIRLRVCVLAPDLVRIRAQRLSDEEPDRSYAIVRTDWPKTETSVSESPSEVTVSAFGVRVTVRRSDGALTVEAAEGAPLLSEAAVTWSADGPTLAWTQPTERRIYGCGEQAGPLDRRGGPMVFWNLDHYEYPVGGGPLYQSIPFCLGMDGPLAHGLFMNNTFRQVWDMGEPGTTRARIQADGGALDLYVFAARNPKTVLARYTELTGRMTLPPLWALGYQQSRYSYYPELNVRAIAEEFRRRAIPCDVLYLDIHYMDEYKCFTWDRSRFPDPRGMISDLNSNGFRVISIIDPGVKVADGYRVYEELKAKGFYVKNPDGTPFIGPVWPGDCLFPDFTNPACRAWWGDQYGVLLDDGVSAFWNDMNEPAVFETESKTMPPDLLFDGDGCPGAHRRYHNVYGMQMARATYEGLLRLRPDGRAFVLSRAGYAGSQRYAATWTGDNVASWDHLRVSIPMVLNLGLSGQAISGPDIGGFVGDPTPEMFARWLQFGALMPFCRTHSARATHDVIHAEGSHPQEPWSWGEGWAALNKASIELRYRLLPYLYTLFDEMTRTGTPVMRPMFLEFPDDPACAGLDDQFMLGGDILAAPVVVEGDISRSVYLPDGLWYDFWTGERHAGRSEVVVDAPIDRLPLFVRAGAALPLQPVVQHVDASREQPIQWHAYLGPDGASGTLYEDDGETMAHRDGQYRRTHFTVKRAGDRLETETAAEGDYRSPRPEATMHLVGW